jgi:diaminopimelate decarboxylase
MNASQDPGQHPDGAASELEIPPHAPLRGFSRRDGRLCMAGEPVGDLVERHGGSPLYLISREIVARRIAELRRLLDGHAELFYAIKANPLAELLRFMQPQVDGFDVASGGELATALAAGCPAERISFAGPGKTDGELEAAASAGATITAESWRQFERAIEAGRRAGRPPHLALRVNPDLQLRGAGMKMGGGASPFGIDEEAIPGVLAQAAAMGQPVEGLHFFFGSQLLRGESIAEAMTHCAQTAMRWLDRLPQPLKWLNLGGGFGVPHFPGERHPDLAPVGEALARVSQALARRSPGTALRIELGRYLVAEAGVYACRVLETKVSRGKRFVVVDGGMHHLQAATGTFGQVIRRNYPIALVEEPPAAGRPADPPKRGESGESDAAVAEAPAPTDVVGPLCTPLDCLGRDVLLPDCHDGSLLCVFRCGAYGASASPADFLGHPHVREVLV